LFFFIRDLLFDQIWTNMDQHLPGTNAVAAYLGPSTEKSSSGLDDLGWRGTDMAVVEPLRTAGLQGNEGPGFKKMKERISTSAALPGEM